MPSAHISLLIFSRFAEECWTLSVCSTFSVIPQDKDQDPT